MSAGDQAPIEQSTIVWTFAIFMVLSVLFTTARMCTRFFVHRQLWWDDWAMLASCVFTIGLCGAAFRLVHHGAGRNLSDLSAEDIAGFSKVFFICAPVSRVAIFLAKLSILLLYMRVFYPRRARRDTVWWITQVVILLNLLYTVALVLLATLQCVPSGRPFGASCVNEWLVFLFNSLMNSLSDIVVLAVPVVSVWKLHMTWQKKWAIWALFGFGTLAPLMSITRLVYQIVEVRGNDLTITYTIVAILMLAELVIATIAGCVPVISAWALMKMKKDGLTRRSNHTPTQRLRPNRELMESHGKPSGVRLKKITGPFPITNDTTLTSSKESLCPRIAPTDNSAGSNRGSAESQYQTYSTEASNNNPSWRCTVSLGFPSIGIGPRADYTSDRAGCRE